MSQALLAAAAGALGACLGSFLNVVIHRLPQDEPAARSLGGRSRCPGCGTPIRWHDNVPVLGWLMLRGKARCCGTRIAARYPLVELLTAVLFALLALYGPRPLWGGTPPGWLSGNLATFAFQAAFVAMLVASTFIDMAHRILPSAINYPGLVLGLIGAVVAPGLAGDPVAGRLTPAMASLLASALGALAGAGLTWTIRVVAQAFFRREAMGLGDVKFMAMIGAFVGWQGALLTFFLGCVLGAVVGIVHRWLTRDEMIPFGPFLAVGALLTLFWQKPILWFLFETWPAWQRESPTAPWLVAGAALLSLIALVMLVRRRAG